MGITSEAQRRSPLPAWEKKSRLRRQPKVERGWQRCAVEETRVSCLTVEASSHYRARPEMRPARFVRRVADRN
ncbi:hypothetical protein MTO96_023828 [Rhipicephalus appendiculatus]